MASGISENGQNLLLDLAFGAYATTPTSIQIALLLSMPTSDDDILQEPPAGAGYSRQTIANGSSMWLAASNGLKFSNTAVVFPVATADWGAILGYAIINAQTGQTLMWGDLNDQPNIQNGNQYSIGAGLLSVSIGPHEPGIIA